eukprot:9207057-Pyramimonas_sp.AAC.1
MEGVEERRRQDSQDRSRAWREFGELAADGSGKLAHAIARPKLLEEAPNLAKGQPHGLVGAAAITAALAEWGELWISGDRVQEAAPADW